MIVLTILIAIIIAVGAVVALVFRRIQARNAESTR